MKVFLLITTYNRPEYLQKCLGSLSKADLLGISAMVIVDDCSTDLNVPIIIYEMLDYYHLIQKKKNSGIKDSLKRGYSWAFERGADLVINLDADAIVKPDFVSKLVALYDGKHIVSGFNCHKPHNPVLSEGEGFVMKKEGNGINMLIDRAQYDTIVLPALNRKHGNWDTDSTNKHPFKITRPSVVDHIGIDSAMGHFPADRSCDFDPVTKCKAVLIAQPLGIGDCIFSQSIAQAFMAVGHPVLWPVMPAFMDGLQRAYPGIDWVNWTDYQKYMNIKTDCVVDDYLISPIRWSDQVMKVPYREVMRAKYDMYGLDWRDWKAGAKWKRDTKREQALMKHLGIKKGDSYNLINKTFRSDAGGKVNIRVTGIEMTAMPGYSLFDWAAVIENAAEIHAVSSSILYLLEMLDLKQPLHLYARPDDRKFEHVNYLFTKPYILHK